MGVYDWLAIYLAIGCVSTVVLLFIHRYETSGNSDFVKTMLDSLNPERKSISYRLREALAILIAAILIVIAWPIALAIQVNDTFRSSRRSSADKPVIFAVEAKHLKKRMSLSEVEAFETIREPMGAAPILPFGHLHSVWLEFKEKLDQLDEIWAFECVWIGPYGAKWRKVGYCSVNNSVPGHYFLVINEHLQH